MMCARANRADDLVGLSGGENELQVRRWLFNQFEKCICRGIGELVCLIDDVHPESRANRRIHGALT